MSTNVIQIKCPACGAVLAVADAPSLRTKSITCPVCKQKSAFSEFKMITPRRDEQQTQYPGGSEAATQTDEATRYRTQSARTMPIGQLVYTGTAYKLHPGRNVVGRKASQSAADIQIPTGENRRMSRDHVVIDVKEVAGKGFVHTVSLCKERCNATYVGAEQLEWGDAVILHDGDTLRLPDANLRFTIPDEEATEVRD